MGVTSQSQPEPTQPTKNPFIHLKNETNHYIYRQHTHI